MRAFKISAVFIVIVACLICSLPSAAQSSATPSSQPGAPSSASPQAQPGAPSSASPQAQPGASQSPAQSVPGQPGGSPTSPSPSAPGQTPGASTSPSATATEENPLGLTDEQKAKLRPILIEESQQMDAVRNDSSLSQDQKVAKANEIREKASPKIKAVLTPEQLQKLAEMQKAKQAAPPSSQPPK